MQTDNEKLCINFNTTASNMYFDMLSKFNLAVKKLNRQKDEYGFCRQKNACINSLKQQLEIYATELLQTNQCEQQLTGLNESFQILIGQYLHCFLLKIRSF